jgi:CheY-like chemotaxis protein
VLPRIFDPFFTTKERSERKGLGLATVYASVHQALGRVMVESPGGRAGTTVTIWLPELQEPSAAAAAAPLAGPRAAVAPGERPPVLVVEDDEVVRRVTCGLLQRAGYPVRSVPDAAAAIAALQDPRDQTRILLSDVMMPSMSGGQLAEVVRTLRPDVHTVLMTGHLGDAALRRAQVGGDVPLLQKPFTQQQLDAVIRRVLGAR